MNKNKVNIFFRHSILCIAIIVATFVLTQSKTIHAEIPTAANNDAITKSDNFEIIPAWFHVHLKFAGDDGVEPSAKIIEYLKSKDYRGIVFAPHSANIDFNEFSKEVMQYDSPEFLVVPGREIVALTEEVKDDVVMCHLNAVSNAVSPKILDMKYPWDKQDELLSELDAEDAIYIWNHPWCCKRWQQSAGKFKGIELFNDFGPGYPEGKTYDFNKKEYLGALKNDKRLFVVSGIDMHGFAQASLGDFTTYFLTDEFSKESIMKAMRNGNTIAAFNAKLVSINERPSIKDRKIENGSFKVEGIASLKTAGGKRPALVIYRNGEVYTPAGGAKITRGEKGSGGYASYGFSFGDTLPAGSSACYVFEIPHYMFSSPYCYTAK